VTHLLGLDLGADDDAHGLQHLEGRRVRHEGIGLWGQNGQNTTRNGPSTVEGPVYRYPNVDRLPGITCDSL
jgi:hypothetical protein